VNGWRGLKYFLSEDIPAEWCSWYNGDLQDCPSFMLGKGLLLIFFWWL